MQPTPLIARQFLRSASYLARATSRNRAPSPALFVKQIVASGNGPQLPAARSVCLRCQLRAQIRFYSAYGGDNGLGRNGRRRSDVDEENNVSSNAEKEQPVLDPGSSPGESTGHQQGMTDFREQQQPEDHDSGGEVGKTGNLPSEAERRRSSFARKFGDVMDNMQSNVFIAGRHLNYLTGYSSIEKLKQEIQQQEERVRETRAAVHRAKETYSAAINRRSTSQREVNELLQRKHAWAPQDLERFTSLYRSDHTNERTEAEAQEALTVAERDAEEAASKLNKNILARYHEEQIWSDKIRRMSTWGTWGLMGVNVLLFLIFQVAVEPWRRQRLVRGFEDKVLDALEKDNNGVKAPSRVSGLAAGDDSGSLATVSEVEPVSPATPPELSGGEEAAYGSLTTRTTGCTSAQGPSASPAHILPSDATSPEPWRQAMRNLFSDRMVNLAQRDITAIALESAAAGAAVMGVLVAVFRLQ